MKEARIYRLSVNVDVGSDRKAEDRTLNVER